MSNIENQILADIDEKIRALKEMRLEIEGTMQRIQKIADEYEKKGADSMSWTFLFVRGKLRAILQILDMKLDDYENFRRRIEMIGEGD
jgi:hypothetical protein